MAEPLFSVVIPAYNYAHSLRRAVESVLRQAGADHELLVVNDGSSDDTEGLLAQLEREYPGAFRHVTRANSGVAATRNFGVDQTTGEYLIFLDADDALCDGALALFGEAVKKNPGVGMVVGGHISVSAGGHETAVTAPLLPDEPYLRVKQYLVAKSLRLSNGAVAIHRGVFQKYRYPERFRSVEDIPLFAYILANYSLASVDSPVCFIYKHDDSLRHNVASAKSIGLDVVDEIFEPSRLPGNIQTLKDPFTMQRLLSLSRTCFSVGDKAGCRRYFREALKRNWKVIFQLSYSSKYVKSFF